MHRFTGVGVADQPVRPADIAVGDGGGHGRRAVRIHARAELRDIDGDTAGDAGGGGPLYAASGRHSRDDGAARAAWQHDVLRVSWLVSGARGGSADDCLCCKPCRLACCL